MIDLVPPAPTTAAPAVAADRSRQPGLSRVCWPVWSCRSAAERQSGSAANMTWFSQRIDQLSSAALGGAVASRVAGLGRGQPGHGTGQGPFEEASVSVLLSAVLPNVAQRYDDVKRADCQPACLRGESYSALVVRVRLPRSGMKCSTLPLPLALHRRQVATLAVGRVLPALVEASQPRAHSLGPIASGHVVIIINTRHYHCAGRCFAFPFPFLFFSDIISHFRK